MDEPPAEVAGHPAGSPGYRRITLALFLAGLATMALLYCPQPVLPEIASGLGVSPGGAAWTVSATTAALGVALLVAGPLSEVVGRVPLIRASLLASGVVALACGLVDGLAPLLALRALLGVTLAGLPAVALAYLTEEVDAGDAARAAGLYIGGTAMGGLLGRLLTGALADLWGWRLALAGMGVWGLACAAAVIALLPPSRRFTPAPADARHLRMTTRAILSDPALLALFGIGATSMGAFVGIFNALGFRLTAAPYGLSVGVAGLVFAGYALGSLSSTWAGRAADRWERRAIAPIVAAVLLLGILGTLAAPLWAIVLAVAVLTMGFFALHGLASGWVPVRARRLHGASGQAGSLYLVAYYGGSSIFGALTGAAWGAGGWTWVVASTGALAATAFALTLALRAIPAPPPDGRSAVGPAGGDPAT